MLTDEYLLPLVLTPVRNPLPPMENEIPVLLIVIRKGPILYVLRNCQPMTLQSKEKMLNHKLYQLGFLLPLRLNPRFSKRTIQLTQRPATGSYHVKEEPSKNGLPRTNWSAYPWAKTILIWPGCHVYASHNGCFKFATRNMLTPL